MRITLAQGRELEERTTFTMTEDHRKLLRRMCVQWHACETGAPEVDPKRPYGNSSVSIDVAEILGWSVPNEERLSGCEYERQSADLESRAAAIHVETVVALQILVSTGQDAPGKYVRESIFKPWEPAPR